MKTTKFFYGMAAFATLGLASCSSDAPELKPDQEVADVDQKVYVNLAIHGDTPSGTRGSGDNGKPDDNDTDFEAGTGDESKITNAYFVFYDTNGKKIGNIVTLTGTQLKKQEVTAATGTVESYYYTTVEVDVFKGEGKPAQVICFINPKTPADLQNPLNQIQTVTRVEVEGGTNGFPMSNSVYYNGTTAENPTIAVQISNDNLFKTEAEAKTEAENPNSTKTLDIYVERYASRLTFTNKAAQTPYVTSTSVDGVDVPVELTFNVTGWDVNAVAKNTYVVKSFREPSATGEILPTNYTYGQANVAINGTPYGTEGGGFAFNNPLNDANSWAWNNADYHRSYWGASPAYFTAKYPQVASQIEAEQAGSNQDYISFNEVKYKKDNESNPIYLRETTVGARALLSENPAAAMPSVILVGKYSIKVGGTAIDGNPTFYTYLKNADGKAYVYFEAQGDKAASAVTGGESMLMRFFRQQTVLYKKVGENYVRLSPEEDLDKLAAITKIAHPSDDVLNGVLMADRNYTLQLKSDVDLTDVYVANGNGYSTIGATDDADNKIVTLNTANRNLMQQVGHCVKYTTGMGFYNIPIRHLGWYRPGNDQKEAKKIVWSKVRIGDFGLVRNHSYNIEVNNIEGLATGIAGEDTPIVPPADTEQYYMAYRVRILKWAIVPTQGVDL